jgi:hypothetical protein
MARSSRRSSIPDHLAVDQDHHVVPEDIALSKAKPGKGQAITAAPGVVVPTILPTQQQQQQHPFAPPPWSGSAFMAVPALAVVPAAASLAEATAALPQQINNAVSGCVCVGMRFFDKATPVP